MTHPAAVRATSLMVSAGLLSAGLIIALTFTYTLPMLQIDDRAAIDVIAPEAPPPPPPRPIREPLAAPSIEDTPTLSHIVTPELTTLVSDPSEIGPTSAPEIQTIAQPRWLNRPRDLERYYPQRPLRMGVEGDVVLNCLVATTGYLRCSIVSESPPGWGFGQAALRMAADHRMAPATRDGAPVEGRYAMRVPFRVE